MPWFVSGVGYYPADVLGLSEAWGYLSVVVYLLSWGVIKKRGVNMIILLTIILSIILIVDLIVMGLCFRDRLLDGVAMCVGPLVVGIGVLLMLYGI